MAKKTFKAESKRLLELMIHSIYTNKEIFLRELISNASDATDKRYYQNSQAGGEALNRNELPIKIEINQDARTLTIEDHGCGMTAQELEGNLGTIAKSGSLDFKKNMEPSEEVDIIGQFGVGFYSAFMVADKVEVLSKTIDGEANLWISEGIEGYNISPAEKETVGTRITLTIKKSDEKENYDEFIDSWNIRNLIKKHSDYIRYPIVMEVEKVRDKVGGEEGETETYLEEDTLNSMTPIWKKRKSEVKEEEYNSFYKDKFFDYQDPLKVIYTSTEGLSSYNALLFIPKTMPMNYHSKDFKKGLKLYASGVLIMDYCSDLLPDYFGFIRGIVDSQDLSLNISREMLQQDSQLTFIASRLEKKIQSELLSMLENEREKYEEMFKNFGLSIKYGVYESYGAKKELLQDLLIFHSSKGKMTTLKEYVENMPEDQKYIYYASGENMEQIKNLPASESVTSKGYELLYMVDQIDEFTIKVLNKYMDKEFRSVTGGDLGLETEEEKEELVKQSEESKELLDYIKEALGDKVSAVEVSNRAKSFPVCLTTKGDLTLEMEKVLSSMPGNNLPIKAERVLELNPEHPVFETLNNLLETDKEKIKIYAEILYNQALMLEGLPIEDPIAYTKAINELLV